jgi:hypothetical protein
MQPDEAPAHYGRSAGRCAGAGWRRSGDPYHLSRAAPHRASHPHVVDNLFLHHLNGS